MLPDTVYSRDGGRSRHHPGVKAPASYYQVKAPPV